MNSNIFELTTAELDTTASALRDKIEEGFRKNGEEILAIPTYVYPKNEIPDGKVLALDWGGTNFRAAVIEYKNGKPHMAEEPVKIKLGVKETAGFSREKLFEAMTDAISRLETLDKSVTRIGFCFSYAAESLPNGDVKSIEFAKGMDFPDLVGQNVGELLVNYLNSHKGIGLKGVQFTGIKVVNDTVTCLFAGLGNRGYDAYMGLIVGTGYNMAMLMPKRAIKKLDHNTDTLIPINLESGNFNPPYLTVVDGLVDSMTNNKGRQRFEKTISGGYIGEIFKTVFMQEKLPWGFDGGHLSRIINNPADHPADQVRVANWIYERSARQVAASIAGVARVITDHNPEARNLCLAADGSVFWGKDNSGNTNYKDMVARELEHLLPAGVKVTIPPEMEDPNLIGSAIAALS